MGAAIGTHNFSPVTIFGSFYRGPSCVPKGWPTRTRVVFGSRLKQLLSAIYAVVGPRVHSVLVLAGSGGFCAFEKTNVILFGS